MMYFLQTWQYTLLIAFLETNSSNVFLSARKAHIGSLLKKRFKEESFESEWYKEESELSSFLYENNRQIGELFSLCYDFLLLTKLFFLLRNVFYLQVEVPCL